MFRLHVRAGSVLLAALALAGAASSPASAQNAEPTSVSWSALPGIMTEGASVVVKTRDGHSTKGRFRSLTDTAIAVESGQVKTISAADVVSIEEQRGKRPVMRGMKRGLYGGLIIFGFFLMGAAPYADGQPCAPADESCVTGSDVLAAAIALPALGAAIGAGLGALMPGTRTRTLVYQAGADVRLGFAPVAGKGRRGAALRVTF